ncbi:hypothetical protein BpHYR1_007143 [Brachionus plicatilis]|uniref:Uncharacterized protein n=1 Tax=Brachionus plicatilis TaxID=10195 RepID=A0A3M7SQ04_BRAPC|nr:hypothetical protein BpHYR1_007143 [Brachionus plicatilis]
MNHIIENFFHYEFSKDEFSRHIKKYKTTDEVTLTDGKNFLSRVFRIFQKQNTEALIKKIRDLEPVQDSLMNLIFLKIGNLIFLHKVIVASFFNINNSIQIILLNSNCLQRSVIRIWTDNLRIIQTLCFIYKEALINFSHHLNKIIKFFFSREKHNTKYFLFNFVFIIGDFEKYLPILKNWSLKPDLTIKSFFMGLILKSHHNLYKFSNIVQLETIKNNVFYKDSYNLLADTLMFISYEEFIALYQKLELLGLINLKQFNLSRKLQKLFVKQYDQLIKKFMSKLRLINELVSISCITKPLRLKK